MGKIRRKGYRGLAHDEWLEIRKTFSAKGMVGGSDIGTIMHANEYKSATELYYDMVGITGKPFLGNQATMHGHHLEEYIADSFRYYDGDVENVRINRELGTPVNEIRNYNYIVTNSDFPAQFANIDRRISKYYRRPNKPGILECKNMRGYVFDKYKGGVPPSYLLQVQNYMAVLEMEYAVIAQFVDGAELHFFEVERSDYLIEQMRDAANSFQASVIEGRKIVEDIRKTYPHDPQMRDMLINQELLTIGPDVSETKSMTDFLSDQHLLRAETVSLKADATVTDTIALRHNMHEHKKALEASMRLIDNSIRDYMVRNGVNVIDLGFNGTVSWYKQLRYNYKEDML